VKLSSSCLIVAIQNTSSLMKKQLLDCIMRKSFKSKVLGVGQHLRHQYQNLSIPDCRYCFVESFQLNVMEPRDFEIKKVRTVRRGAHGVERLFQMFDPVAGTHIL
jgi:hypothetical protein